MRLFLAIDLEPPIRAGVARVQERLQAAGGDVRWSPTDNLHLTVLFLGDLAPSALPGIDEACAAIAAETDAFRIRVRGASAFPKRGPLKTLYLKIDEGADRWEALVRRAEPWFVPMGVARNGGLAPHVTLGRVRSQTGETALRTALEAEADTEIGAQAVPGVWLVESFLDRGGATYQNRGFHPFRETEAQSV